jgi:hypothetical protein
MRKKIVAVLVIPSVTRDLTSDERFGQALEKSGGSSLRSE